MINAVVDLYHGDPVSSFETVKAAGIAGIIHKATQGASFQDHTYHDRRTQARAAGLLWGAYHFGEGGDGAEQARSFLSYVQPEATDLLVLDFETNTQGASMSLAEAEQFVTAVHSATGRWPGLYSSPSYVSEALGQGTSPILANCWLWIADYAASPIVPSIWPYWTLWQYTDGTHGPEPHSVDGIGNCDRDQFNGSLEQLQKLWGGSDLMASERRVIHSDPEILGGTPVFIGTRVPAQALRDYLEGGHPLDEFLEDFPTVAREQAIAALDVWEVS